MGEELRVDPAVLSAAAGACQRFGEATARQWRRVEPETVDAARALPGWRTARALQDTLGAWEDDMTRLVAHLQRLGTALEECAADYRRADAASAGHFDIRGR
ncbi:MAG TPA: type VII secretion target [Pilimelia sp.]|nr:type VII secretion target [Pilimelia sp.]